MDASLLHALAVAPSWSVTYDGEVYEDARSWADIWYFCTSVGGRYWRFEGQEKVTPICKNPTRKKHYPVGP